MAETSPLGASITAWEFGPSGNEFGMSSGIVVTGFQFVADGNDAITESDALTWNLRYSLPSDPSARPSAFQAVAAIALATNRACAREPACTSNTGSESFQTPVRVSSLMVMV